MQEEERDHGFLSGTPEQSVQPDTDPMTAVRAVAEPRAVAKGMEASGGDAPEIPSAGQDADRHGKENQRDYGEFDWPEGYVADAKAMGKFVPLAQKLGLSRESAQELARLYAELDQEKQRAQADFIAANNAEWLREIHNHPEFGGRNIQRSSEEVAGMMRRFGSPLLMAQIRQMNIQNWPEMYFFLARISRVLSEDCSPSGRDADAPAKSTAQLLFPGLK